MFPSLAFEQQLAVLVFQLSIKTEQWGKGAGRWVTTPDGAVTATADAWRPKSACICQLALDERRHVPVWCASGVAGYVGILAHQAGAC